MHNRRMQNVPTSPPEARERRRYRRYIVKGSVVVLHSSAEIAGELLNLGFGGVLVRTKIVHPEGTRVTLTFQFNGYPEETSAQGLVVGTKPDLMAVKFLEEPAGIESVLNWLEMEHYPWTANA
jgi:hypothetical protein